MTEETIDVSIEMEDVQISTGWSNPPQLGDLQQNLSDAKPAKDEHTLDVDRWLDNLNITGTAKIETKPNRSSVQPKLIRKNNEWRYPALSEPFLATSDIFNVTPYTYEDKEAARQNALLLNHQFNYLLNKVSFIDEYVRTAVDEGTVFCRVGWEFEEEEQDKEETVWDYRPAQVPEQVEQLQYESQKMSRSPEWEEAVKRSNQFGQPIVPVAVGTNTVTEMVTVKNQPTVEVVDFRNLTIDPSCDGDLKKAQFVIMSFDTSKAELEASGLYKNLDEIMINSNSTLGASDDEFDNNDDTDFSFKDDPRKRIVAHEYWGHWDINGDGTTVPIVATWVGNTLIRMEENPFPDQMHPFVSAQYLPVRKSLYGQPDGELLLDNQKIQGALTRGMIDIMARSANGQTGMRKDMLDTINRRKFANGEDYEFNQIADPRQGIFMHTFPEIPASAQFLLQQQQFEAESMTGVRPFGATAADTSSATAARDAMDAASKRETAILRRLAEGIKEVGHKIISMNQEFLSDQEIIRVTNEKFVEIKREDLAGRFDLVLDISTAEEDNAKAQELAFMLQTVGPNTDPKMVYTIMADIADLRKMPELAERLRNYEPQPDPMAVALQEAELAKLQLENSKIQLEMAKLQSEVQLNQQKAGVESVKQGNIQADTDLKTLEYVEEELGVKHERELQKDSAQARANLQRDLIMNAQKPASGSNS
ncbi:hypothetical protein VPMG_00074 [Vibrio phage VBP32]|uniref:Portal protein n=2 Tax=Stoningtonvirus VBP47 TaxID=2846606 RepID=M4T2L9_9CAUD|nr:portal protein [Vibrio phage VBP47]YP_007676564.1 portal protein [Vibrio phage VBP32]AGH57079.1 hypothetical protein VPNG_00055 [Vibrio phage VBP47]AGH57213.1 hypothetical protein VPMG_00074 [Vibrio phage VBP32]